MPKLTYKGGLPPREEFRQTIAATNPVDDLLLLSDQLRKYEDSYQNSSA